MNYKDETIWDKIKSIRYSLIWIVWFAIAVKAALFTAKHYDSHSLAPAIPVVVVMVIGLLFQKYKLLGED